MSETLEKQLHLKLYNTETKQLEVLSAPESGPLRMYTCGPTVYNYAHIGNLRTYVFEDLLRKTIKYFGIPIKQVMNLTDVDDKTIKGALEEKVSLEDFTEKYKEAFFTDLATLNIEEIEQYPSATEYISEMIQMIQTLIEKGSAYLGKDNCVYFRISTFPSYGRLSHLKLEDLKEGASERVCSDEYDKENVGDFVLWKAYDEARDGDIYWNSPFGKGRPGWHIECSCMAAKLLGESIDLHIGGVDNIFPHHENEIAQSEACFGKRFVKHWMHSEHLIVDGKKMSKSLGNFYTLRDLLKQGFSGGVVRYMLLQTHYRTQLNFTIEGLNSAKNSLRRVEDFVLRLKSIKDKDSSEDVEKSIEKAKKSFKEALGNDLAISSALAALFDLIREINTLCDVNKVSKKDAKQILETLEDFNTVLSCLPLEPEEEAIPNRVQELLKKRDLARKDKNFKLADRLRDEIHESGYIIEDSDAGSKLKKKD